MAKVPVYNSKGDKIEDIEVSDKVFKLEINPILVQQLVTTVTANKRQILSHTKGRSEVSGGGKKPWKQKGTGRARHGSIRSPLWSGGGVTFGPTSSRNFSKKMNKKARMKAMMMVLSDKLASKVLFVIDKLEIADKKTKEAVKIIEKLPVKDKKTLIVISGKNDNFKIASRNLPKVKVTQTNSLNILDLLNFPYVLFTKKALVDIDKKYS